MTEIPEALYAQARVTLAYALTKQKEGDVEGAVEVIARGMMKPVSEWRPIETAPKGKDYIVLGNGEGQVMIGFYNEPGWDDGDFFSCETWPTHWMPLPKPPEAP